MTIQQSTEEGVTVISPVGRIDTTTSGPLEDAFRKSVDAGVRDLVVDFSAVEYISSAGLRVFLVLARQLRDLRGRLVLCRMQEPVRQVFHLAGFTPLFVVEPSRESALMRFLGRP